MLEQILLYLDGIFKASSLMGLAVSFAAGVLASFSPCIYPMIPITLGITGAVSSSSKRRSFFVSLIFVSGIAVVYTSLGLIASLTGVLMGAFMINPVTYGTLCIVFFVLGASEMGWLRLKIPFFSFHYDRVRGEGIATIFILGLVSGLAMIPCNFPVLFSILNLIALKKNIFYGGFALLLFSLGYGLILIILGTFTFLIGKLPKQGPWLIISKRIIGVILMGVSCYFLYHFIFMLQ